MLVSLWIRLIPHAFIIAIVNSVPFSHDATNNQIPIYGDHHSCDQLQFNTSDDVHINNEYTYAPGTPDADLANFNTAFQDLLHVLDAVLGPVGIPPLPNPLHQPTFLRYFAQDHWESVRKIFETVRTMARGGFQDIPGFAPLNLQSITVNRGGGGEEGTTLAQAFGVERATAVPKTITVYDVGWNSLFKRRLADVVCADVGPVTNYKMHVLGTLLLHETLYALASFQPLLRHLLMS